jgi:hypothetical protein
MYTEKDKNKIWSRMRKVSKKLQRKRDKLNWRRRSTVEEKRVRCGDKGGLF